MLGSEFLLREQVKFYLYGGISDYAWHLILFYGFHLQISFWLHRFNLLCKTTVLGVETCLHNSQQNPSFT